MRILLVEDDDLLADTLCRGLTAEATRWMLQGS
jgi:DNA-binding response OmpR family regulator